MEKSMKQDERWQDEIWQDGGESLLLQKYPPVLKASHIDALGLGIKSCIKTDSSQYPK